MRKPFITLFILLIAVVGNAQTASDLFKSDGPKITWLGVDYSHVKLIGDFSEFGTSGDKNAVEIRDKFFGSWNNLVLAEPKKYDIAGMLNKSDVTNDIAMIMKINNKADVEDMEVYDNPNYTDADIKRFVAQYDTKGKDGIGVAFVAESLNKNATEAYYHFVAINMNTGELLIQKRLRGAPGGFGLRNYWAGSMYSVIKDIKKSQYKKWKKEYAK